VKCAWSVVLALIGVAWMLAPRGVPGRACGLALLAPAFLMPPPAPKPGEAWITAFDVGQGLAVLVRTANRTLVYDAGPAYGPDADSGGRVVLPALRAAGASGVDVLVLTHEDLDHVGGALSVLEGMPVQALASSLPRTHPLNSLAPSARACTAGESWDWDGVRFAFLHPQPTPVPGRRNDQSCVLKVSAGGRSILLTGDIERASELALLKQDLRVDVLLVPHHGSRSSSSREFVAAVAPRWAVVAAGHRNRFGHPHPEVIERYRAARAELLQTGRDGAVHVLLGPAPPRVESERARRPRYWRRVPTPV
jgi:competence protein ComEC